MKRAILTIGVGAGIAILACTADLRDNNVCVMYARALCNKASTCGMLGNQSADQCLAPYLGDSCKDWKNEDSNPDPRECGSAIEDAACPGDDPVPLPACTGTLTKQALQNIAAGKGTALSIGDSNANGAGGSSGLGGRGSGGSGATSGAGGLSMTGVGGRGTGGAADAGTTGAGCTNTCEYAKDGDCDDGAPGSVTSLCALGTDCSDCGSRSSTGTGGSGGSSATGTCSSFVPDPTFPCGLTVPSSCGGSAVSCGGNSYCVANSACGSGSCTCNSGYLAVSCSTGQRCSGCSSGTWGCAQKPDPGCSGNPSQTAGVCQCSNGTSYKTSCGSTTTCDQHCKQGF